MLARTRKSANLYLNEQETAKELESAWQLELKLMIVNETFCLHYRHFRFITKNLLLKSHA